ncbi:MAG: glycoside hydrolase family 125 protein [Bacteroidales bacterium]|nr:glycoside hydrolase family 125 protein [Bacteroidales bacterium]
MKNKFYLPMMAAAAIMTSCGQNAPKEAVQLTHYDFKPFPVEEFVSQRPAPEERKFSSEAVEKKIVEVTSKLTNPRLAWMFANCFPNTLDTTVNFGEDENGNPDTFVITGDIFAMWLRDSGAQVWPYVQLANEDDHLRAMIEGTIRRQFKCITIDPYANAFNFGPTGGYWQSDFTRMNLNDHERKWEIDSQCYPIRLAYEYWKKTGDDTIFDGVWVEAVDSTLTVLREQQRKENRGSYRFMRETHAQYDTKSNSGYGNPVKPCGLIVSSFRPSDDATVMDYLIPSNFFAVTSLRKAAEILETVNKDAERAASCRALADEVEAALKENAIVKHPKYGEIYAFECDGFGNHLMMDDANVPSLLAMSYLGDVPADDPIYQNTRRFVLSEDNPYFFRGEAGEGVGGPHVGVNYVWPMSIMMRAFTSDCDEEIKFCIEMLMCTDAGTGFMHESFHKDNAADYTRDWFAWQNTLFGELIIKIIDDGRLDVLNSITIQ